MSTKSPPRPTAKPSPPSKGAARSGRSPLLTVVVVAILAIAVAAVLLSRSAEDPVAGFETAPVTVIGDALPAFPTEGLDPAVGLPAPKLRGVDFDGGWVEYEYGVRPMIVVFAAHWCPACQAEIPALAPWLAEGNPEGVDVLTVSTGVQEAAQNYPPSTWFAREGWTAPVLLDSEDGTAAAAYGLEGFPFFVFIDADGNVAGRSAGMLGPERLDAIVEQLTS